MRRFELIEGSSSKFWEVGVEDLTLSVRFGRIGTAGQGKEKTFASAQAAKAELDKLVKEKTAKGYGEVAVTGAAKPAARVAVTPAAPASSALASVPAAPMPAAKLQPAPAANVAVGTALAWPEGGFQWTDELRAELPVVRGIHVPPLRDLPTLLDDPIVFAVDRYGYHDKRLAELAQAAGRHWTRWDEARCAAFTRPQALAEADAESWLEFAALASTLQLVEKPGTANAYSLYYAWRRGLAWVADVGTAVRGLPAMLETAFELVRYDRAKPGNSSIVQDFLGPLRRQIAAATDAQHDEAIALLERIAGATPEDRLLRAYLCPHRGDWAAACVAEAADDPWRLLKDCVLPPEAALRYLRDVHPYMQTVRSALLLQLHLHGTGAFELLAHMLRRTADRDNGEKFTTLMMRLHDPRTVDLLAELIDRKEARAALEKLAERYPAAVLKTVAERAFASRSRTAEGWAVRLALRDAQALSQALPALDAAARERLQSLLAALQQPDAAPELLPPVLRHPPWLDKARATELPSFEARLPALPDEVRLGDEERQRRAAFQPQGWLVNRAPVQGRETYVLNELQIATAAHARVLAGGLLEPGDIVFQRQPAIQWPELIMLLPPPARLAVWNSYPSHHWHNYGDSASVVGAMLAGFGAQALPGLLSYVQTFPEEGLRFALVVDSPGLVPIAMHALRNLKKAKPVAVDWVRAHAATTAAVALPLAFGLDRTQRDNAQYTLRWLLANGMTAEVHGAAARAGAPMTDALQALIDADPLRVLPTRMPKLPGFFVAASFRRPLLADSGAALPAAAIEHIGCMLAISKLEAPYAGLDMVRSACTRASLAEFAWDLFEAWLAAGAPGKDAWAFHALGHFGDDETARRLAPRIREWPGESAHQRAVTGLDLLAAIGSDVALMHLNGIAGKVKFKALQDRAKEKIAAVAEARGFSAAELADRLVPELGLDEHGTLALDFGPRRFFIGFDETLKPWVKDEAGTRLKDLPKPIKSDDAEQAAAATERFKQLKKDAKAVASLQVTRLEMAMVQRRRWQASDFRLFFIGHPLTRHLAARLVWGVYGADGTMRDAFRVAEDWTLADAEDSLFTLSDEATVGLAHVLEMPAAVQAAFGQVLADYEILQPFRQLGRETYSLTPAELGASQVTRYADKVVSSGSVMGLVNRGWERGEAQDGGHVAWFCKTVGEGLQVDLELDPGIAIGDPSFEPKQRFPAITLRRSGTWDAQGQLKFDKLDPIIVSEVLRDVELMAPVKD